MASHRVGRLLSLSLLGVLLVSSCGTPGQVIDPQVAAQRQSRFESACRFAAGATAMARPIYAAFQAQIGRDLRLGIEAGFKAIDEGCNRPLNINDMDQVTQRVYDAAGQVIALVLKAQQQ